MGLEWSQGRESRRRERGEARGTGGERDRQAGRGAVGLVTGSGPGGRGETQLGN